MQRRNIYVAFLAIALASPLLLTLGCDAGSPEERVETARARYEAALEGWVVRDDPQTMVDAELDNGLEGDNALASAAVEEGEEPPAPGPTRQDVTLNIRLWHNSPEVLPGITLDITHADEQERERETHRVWVDTARLMRGQEIQFDHVLRDVVVEPGDRFAVRVRHPVPAGEREAYQEFAQARGGGE